MHKILRQYPPLKCELNIVYQYDDDIQISRTFKTEEGVQMLSNTNLILQYIDQRKLYTIKKNYIETKDEWKGLIICISGSIVYGHHDTLADDLHTYQLKDFKVRIGHEFNWKIDSNLILTVDTIYVCSFWISNESCITSNSTSQGVLRIFSERDIVIGANSSICMDGTSGYRYTKYDGSTGKCGGGGGYRNKGENGVKSNNSLNGTGGDQYLTVELIRNDANYKRFSVGFAGGCGTNNGSEGGAGGGQIIVLCSSLQIKSGGKITSNGADGINCGGGGSGGSILIIANSTNIDKNWQNKLTVNGGRTNKMNFMDSVGNGSDGIIQFGSIHQYTVGNMVLKDEPLKANDNFSYNFSLINEEFLETVYLKYKLFSYMDQMNDEEQKHDHNNTFKDLSEYLNNSTNRKWISGCTPHLVRDDQFTAAVELFSMRENLNGMSLFQFLFFHCRYYRVGDYCQGAVDLLTENYIQPVFFIGGCGKYIESIHPTQSFLSKQIAKYPPSLCNLTVIYEYDDNDKVYKTSNDANMLRDPNLILQHIDQRKLYQLNKKYLSSNKWEGLTLEINADIEYGNLRIYQIWNHRVNVGKEFNWKIAYDSQLTVDTLYVSSLFITNKSCMHGTSAVHNSEQKQDNIIGGTLRIFCENNLLVDENSSISMDACGIKGAIYDDKTQTAMNQLNCKCNGKNGKTGGGGGYKSMGKHGNERNGGDAYLTDELMQSDINCKRFSVGFGGGCGRYKGSKGGNGGGKIIIACNYLVINGKITANGGEGVYFGGGGSGGSILIITNKIDDDTIKKEGKITVFGGKGNKLNTKGGGDGSDGIIQFGYIDVSTNNLDFKDTIQSVHANYFIPYD
eukprot:250973_1